jgi:hypothetical protein
VFRKSNVVVSCVLQLTKPWKLCSYVMKWIGWSVVYVETSSISKYYKMLWQYTRKINNTRTMRNIYRMNRLFFLELLNGVIDILLMVCQIKFKKKKTKRAQENTVTCEWIHCGFKQYFSLSSFYSRLSSRVIWCLHWLSPLH